MSYDFNIISKPIPAKDSWELIIYPHGINWDGSAQEWAFCLPDLMIINEQFTNGTQHCLSHWYEALKGKPAKHSSFMSMSCSTAPIADATTEWQMLSLTEKDPSAAWHKDLISGHQLWLCPLWGLMWGKQPDHLWIKLAPLD